MNETSYTESYFAKRNVKLTAKGRKWAENAEGIAFALFLLLIFGIVGSIETGKWFG
jgi:hypothetical protein